MKKTKDGSIRKKLLCTMIPLMTILVTIIIVVNLVNTKDTMTEAVNNQMEQETKYNAKVIESWKESIIASLDSVKSTLETVPFASDEEELNYLKTTTSLNKSFPNGVYEADAKGKYLDGSGWTPDADYVPTERDWYKSGVNSETFTFGAPYMDAQSGSFVVSASALVNKPSSAKLVAATDVFLDDVTKMVAEINIMNARTGYAFLVDGATDTILAHQDQTLIATQMNADESDTFMAKISGLTKTDKYAIYTINKNGTPYLVAIQPIEGTTWVIVSCVSQDEVFEELHRMELIYVLLAFVVIALAAFLIGRVIKVTVLPIKTLTHGISRITDGDFTVAIEPKGNDEITVMSRALKEYIHNMSQMIKSIREISDNLAEKAEVSKNTSKTLSVTAGEQAQAMSDMQSTIDQLANAVTDLAQNATTLAQVVDTTSDRGKTANDKMQDTVTIADQGYKDMQSVQNSMLSIVEAIKQLAGVVENVGASTEEINGIVNLIGDIASQTNLLSLNASIEAARAGEAGRGFAVVADEIGNLADVSAKSVQQISNIIGNINNQVNDMVEKTRNSVTTIEQNSDAINVACDTFQHIFEDISGTSDILNVMMEEIQKVNDVASNMAAISEEQSASAEEISATIETLTNHSNQVATESHQVEGCAEVVSESAVALAEDLKNFTVE